VKHSQWGFRAFSVFVTKEAFPKEELAEHLARTLGVKEVKMRLEQATPQGFPQAFPIWNEGWFLL